MRVPSGQKTKNININKFTLLEINTLNTFYADE